MNTPVGDEQAKAEREQQDGQTPKCCPFCSCSTIRVFVAEWHAKSLEPQDLSNEATINEHQCASCGCSFWA